MGKLHRIQAEGFGMLNIDTATDSEIDHFVMGKLRKIQTEGFGMLNIDTATEREIDRYVMGKLHRIQAEGSGMPNVETATDSEIDHQVTAHLTAIRVDAIDDLMGQLIQLLPPTHRLQNFRSDLPGWLQEIEKSVQKAKCNRFQRSTHILKNFSIHGKDTFHPYRIELNKSCAKTSSETLARQILAKIEHLTRHPFPLKDRIDELMKSNSARCNDALVATIASSSPKICSSKTGSARGYIGRRQRGQIEFSTGSLD